MTAPWWLRTMATLGVVMVGCIAAANSYAHMLELAHRFGEEGIRANLSPLAIDGMALVATATMLIKQRTGQKIGWRPWLALGLGLGVSVWANVTAAQPDMGARLWAAMPPLFLLVSIELLVSGFREPSRPPVEAPAGPGPSLQAKIATVQATQVPGSSQDPPVLGLGNPPPESKPQPRNVASTARPAAPVDVADLLPAARDIAGDLGRIPGWKPLAKALRDRDLPCGTPKAQALVAALKAEQNGHGQ